MTFEEMFQQAKTALSKASAKDVTEHIAVQVNVSGEGSGIFYVEASNGVLAIEPYTYFDNDATMTVDSAELLTALKTPETASALPLEGCAEKTAVFRSILSTIPVPKKEPAAPVKKAEEKPAVTKATVKPTATGKVSASVTAKTTTATAEKTATPAKKNNCRSKKK